LYYLGYEKYSDRMKGMEPGTDQFFEFYFKLLEFIGNYYLLTQSKKINKEDNPQHIAQVQFIKFLDRNNSCLIKQSKNIIYINNYTKSTAIVETDPNDFKKSLLKCSIKSGNIISTMLLYDDDPTENDDSAHANTLIINYKKGCIWRVEPNVYYNFWNPVFYDHVDRVLVRYFNDNPDLHLSYKGLYPYTLKSTPNHVGLCIMICVLQLYLPQNMTDFNVKYYILKFFEWEYKNIFHEKFNLQTNVHIHLYKLISFVHKKYHINKFEINHKKFNFKNINETMFKNKFEKIICLRNLMKNSIIFEPQDERYNKEYNPDEDLPKKNVFELINT